MVIFWRMNDIDKGDKNELTAMQIDLWRNLRLQKARIIKWVIYLHNNIRNNSKFPSVWLLVNCGPLRTHSTLSNNFPVVAAKVYIVVKYCGSGWTRRTRRPMCPTDYPIELLSITSSEGTKLSQ